MTWMTLLGSVIVVGWFLLLWLTLDIFMGWKRKDKSYKGKFIFNCVCILLLRWAGWI
jgi:hypothetical protein